MSLREAGIGDRPLFLLEDVPLVLEESGDQFRLQSTQANEATIAV